jgi:hypothetical protein
MFCDEEFVAAFEAHWWPLDKWHHRDHIRLAYLYLKAMPFEAAVAKIREGIRAHNATHGITDAPTSGYHETMTVAWMRLVELALREYGPEDSGEAFCEAHPELMQKKTLRLFYSKDLFMSARAKAEFVEPDLAPLPRARRA